MSRRKQKRKHGQARATSPRRSAGSTAGACAFDPSESRRRVEAALARVGPQPYLLGFEAVGIQEFIAANGRPLAMEGASRTIERFDRQNLDDADAGGVIFAGGGRGLRLLPREQVEVEAEALRRRYAAQTCGGQLATAAVPFDRQRPGESLRWLRLRLDGAKDAAAPPEVPLPRAGRPLCRDCRLRPADASYRDAENLLVPACARCCQVIDTGREGGRPWNLQEIGGDQPIAVISADGNNLGDLFASLISLEEQAVCSDLIFFIFKQAHAQAIQEVQRRVAPVTGGDDIRVFLPARQLFSYALELAAAIHERLADLGSLGLRPALHDKLARLGVGVGAIVAPYHFPAQRLLAMAHELEDEAKVGCLRMGVRSALNFVWLRAGDELSRASESERGEERTLSLDDRALDVVVARAKALREVPSSQRAAMVSARRRLEAVEFMNLFRYQIARSQHWQRWFDAGGIDWGDDQQLENNLPSAQLLDIAELTEKTHAPL